LKVNTDRDIRFFLISSLHRSNFGAPQGSKENPPFRSATWAQEPPSEGRASNPGIGRIFLRDDWSITLNTPPYKRTGLENPSSSLRAQVGPLLLLAGIFCLNFVSRIILAPLLPTIEGDLRVSHGEAGFLFFLISLGYFFTLIGSGFVSSRLNHRNTIILSAETVGMALLFAVSFRSLWGLRTGVLLLGMAAGIYLPSGIATITSLVDARHWGKAIAIHELAPNLSFVAAPLLAETFLPFISWRGILASLGAGSLVMGLVFARFGRGGNFPGQIPSAGSARALLVQPAFWTMMLLFGLGISGSFGVYSMLPLYLVNEAGMDQNRANSLVGFSRILGPFMVFLGGWAVDRFGSKRTMESVFLLSGGVTVLLGVTGGLWLEILVFLQAMLSACFFPAGFAALSSIGPPGGRNVAVSLTLPVAFLLGGGGIPVLIGVMGDAGSFGLGIALVGGLLLTGTLLSFSLRLTPGQRV
jgi:NNP family nitrate/nitrite transporter-like MFS transporter